MVESGSDLILEMMRRSYFAVDGLWFVMLEEDEGHGRALEIDERVWRVMPKIQARKARELLGCTGNTLADLTHCLALKFAAEGHEYHVRKPNPSEACVVIEECPWHAALEKANRTHLGPEIADRICTAEAAGWAAEFGADIEAELTQAICRGDERCHVVFRRTTPPATE